MKAMIKHMIDQHPRHRAAMTMVATEAGASVEEKAAALGEYCRANGVVDFGNPFPGGDERRERWNEAFINGVAETDAEAEGSAVDGPELDPDFAAMSKPEIVEFIQQHRGVALDGKMKKDDLIVAAQAAWAA